MARVDQSHLPNSSELSSCWAPREMGTALWTRWSRMLQMPTRTLWSSWMRVASTPWHMARSTGTGSRRSGSPSRRWKTTESLHTTKADRSSSSRCAATVNVRTQEAMEVLDLLKLSSDVLLVPSGLVRLRAAALRQSILFAGLRGSVKQANPYPQLSSPTPNAHLVRRL